MRYPLSQTTSVCADAVRLSLPLSQSLFSGVPYILPFVAASWYMEKTFSDDALVICAGTYMAVVDKQ